MSIDQLNVELLKDYDRKFFYAVKTLREELLKAGHIKEDDILFREPCNATEMENIAIRLQKISDSIPEGE